MELVILRLVSTTTASWRTHSKSSLDYCAFSTLTFRKSPWSFWFSYSKAMHFSKRIRMYSCLITHSFIKIVFIKLPQEERMTIEKTIQFKLSRLRLIENGWLQRQEDNNEKIKKTTRNNINKTLEYNDVRDQH